MATSRSQEHQLRIEKIEALKKQGVESWPSNPIISSSCGHVKSSFVEGSTAEYTIAGRIMVVREHGKSSFAKIQDASDTLQIYLQKDTLGDAYQQFLQYLDIGDIISCTGTLFKTKTGETTLHITAYTLLSKSLHPLPDKFHGLSDIEIKYRQRYLDLITSPEARKRFVARSHVVRTIRTMLDEKGYLEVETPMLHPLAGGAAAKPFIMHHNALGSDFYLRIAPELYLKRLVVGGFDRVYEINRNFRNEGVSTRHNPEFTMLELYTAYQDLEYAMNLVESLIRTAAYAASGSLVLTYGEHTLDFALPFTRLSMKEAIALHGACTVADLTPERINTVCAQHHINLAIHTSYGSKIAALFEQIAEKKLIQPTFIHSFPIELSPLAKRDPQDPSVARRFELFVAGMEVSNAYHELNDPFEQAQRFHEQLELQAQGDEEAHQFDQDYITALEYGLPPTVGIGIGIDRLVMLLTNTTSIKEVILFPTLKREE